MTAHEHRRAFHQAAAQHPVEFLHAGADAGLFGQADFIKAFDGRQAAGVALKPGATGTLSGPGKGARSARFEGYAGSLSAVKSLDEVSLAEQARISTGMQEFDRVLGGGLVEGSAVLMGGHPGAGKSTLLLQAVCQLAAQHPALYVTGEESLQQVAMRAKRLGLPTKDLKMLSETSVERLLQVAEAE